MGTGKCVACTDIDSSACQSTDYCLNDTCNPNCPSTCATDNDCANCGAPGNFAHACNNGHCSQCSPTYACPSGKICRSNGVCADKCGQDGAGSCSSDGDCIHDADCAGVGITIDVGKLLRDITGISQIHDADLEYPMKVCASVSVGSGPSQVSCGVCVPCRVDTDCDPIDVDGIAGEAFGPIGSVAAAILLDEVFGPNDHKVHMYCQEIAGGYGVCAPCPGIVYSCGGN
jgi:hypothetical protein